jgi:hypothetical protein
VTPIAAYDVLTRKVKKVQIDSTANLDWNGKEAARMLAIDGAGFLHHDKRHNQRLFKGHDGA